MSEPRQSRDSIADVWGERTPHQGPWPERVDERVEVEPEQWVQSCCILCSNGCGMDVGVKGGKIVGVRGRAADRVNKGRLGPKGLHGWVANASPDRLTVPLIRVGSKSPADGMGGPGAKSKFREATWDEAMGLIVRRSREIKDQFTGEAIGIYNTGQLFLEEYYTLSLIAHTGLHTHQIDGNTRLCTATAAQALKETFGRDGQPGSYADLDVTDCLLMAGHNAAHTQTVLWSRILDRRRGPKPPKLIVIDPRRTDTAAEADVHLAPRVGTNLAVMNGLLRQVIDAGHVDRDFIAAHTVGFEELAEKVSPYTPARVEELTGIPAARLREAAHLIGTAPTLFCTVLQGFYQSHQATAASVQVNNLNLIRGMIGRPGCGLLQMNGQPSAENTRETGCNGEAPAFRNWKNPAHMQDLARRWNVELYDIPHWSLPSNAMEIFRHAQTGSVKMLWVVCTNPAVSLPELHRVRKILASDKLFVVVQDAFLTETAALADVVLPAAMWGEKTGTFTNADRTVHLSLKAIEPPGQAKSDLDIFLDYARRMDFRDKDGKPLVKWADAEGAFVAWKECSRGWQCDYSGLSYDLLRGGSGIQWPCNEQNPQGTERLYADHVFPTAAEMCETFGNDIETGASRTAQEYRANDPKGRAILKAADYQPPEEEPDDTYPFWLTTGRVVYHFHTRTKTGRSAALRQAAPEPFVQISEPDAEKLGVADGDVLEVTSRRGTAYAPAKVGNVLPGHVFMPFHYGYWGAEGGEEGGGAGGRPRAANELTRTAWDPVSKQPYFKCAAVQVRKADDKNVLRRAAEAVGDAAGKLAHAAAGVADKVAGAMHAERRRVSDYLGLLYGGHRQFVEGCETVRSRHPDEVELQAGLKQLVQLSEESEGKLKPLMDAYGQKPDPEPKELRKTLLAGGRSGAFGALRDLHELFVMAAEVSVSVTVVHQVAHLLHDEAMLAACDHLDRQNKRQQAWIMTQIEHRAAHTLAVPQ